MRWSNLYIPTLRDDPAEADAASHRLLVRAGFIRQLMSGHYSLLPLAVRVRAKIITIIREEMARIGAQEFLLPTMHPAEMWQKSGRWELMEGIQFRGKDRKGADFALGVTHEEAFTSVAQELHSYRQLPQIWYQFQTKFRDEPRPKSGLLRVREFTMKDSYSFDIDEAGLNQSFERHQAAYQRIFERLGIPAIPVQASNGSMGGSSSIEFMCPTEVGEDFVVHCASCGYAANVEKATSRLAAIDDDITDLEIEQFNTPQVGTIESLTKLHGVSADRQIKTLVYVLDSQLTLILLRGDHGLNEQKLLDATAANSVRPAEAIEIQNALGALPGSLGAVGVTNLPIIADESLRGRRSMVTGANHDGVHLRNVDMARDIAVGQWADLREVTAGEPCVHCGQSLSVMQTVEVGQIFQLGSKYTDGFGVKVLGPQGNQITPIMGCYGIGIERALAAVVEIHHDERGIVWPSQLAPFDVVVVDLGRSGDHTSTVANQIYQDLLQAGIDVVLDDRDERAGVKFRDSELIGIPCRITVGNRGLAQGVVEVYTRSTGGAESISVNDVVAQVQRLIASEK